MAEHALVPRVPDGVVARGAGVEARPDDRGGVRRSGVHHGRLEAVVLGRPRRRARPRSAGARAVHRAWATSERSGFEPIQNLRRLLQRGGRRGPGDRSPPSFPFDPSPEIAQTLVASKDRAHYMDGVEREAALGLLAHRSRFARSPTAAETSQLALGTAALACCDVAVKATRASSSEWLAMPEMRPRGFALSSTTCRTSRQITAACHRAYDLRRADRDNAGTAACTSSPRRCSGISDMAPAL